MKNLTYRAGWLRMGVAIGLTLTLTATGVALAATSFKPLKPVKNGSYSGSWLEAVTPEVTFKISANGKEVIDIYTATPINCSGGCGGFSAGRHGSAKINKTGAFEARMKLTGPGSTKVVGYDTIIGRFYAHNTAEGTVSSRFLKDGSGDRTEIWRAKLTRAKKA